MKTIEIAGQINARLSTGETLEMIKSSFIVTDDKWRSCCLKAYSINLESAKRERRKEENKRHVAATSVSDIGKVIKLNRQLGSYSLLLPIFSTMADFKILNELKDKLPESESKILNYIGRTTMHPKTRVLQKIGRFEKFEYFKPFSKLIDAAVLSYFRTNFISCYFTLIPVIEGIIIRWMGYQPSDVKPEFEDIRKFFKTFPLRNPSPTNILFHDVYVQICDKILNEHFYKPTTNGYSHSHFNRHVASHLLVEDEFATKFNCIRLFLLLDIMTEIFLYESAQIDPRFNLGSEDIEEDIIIFSTVMFLSSDITAEHLLLGSSSTDLLYR